MAYCDSKIAANIVAKCSGQAKGFVATGYIFNYEDINWDAIEENTTVDPNGSVIKTMPLKTGAKGYKIAQNKDAFNETVTNLETGGAYANTWTSEVHFSIIDSSLSGSEAATALASGEFVVLLEQKCENGDASRFRLYGYENGLRASSGSNTPNGDNGNVWEMVLQETGATKSAYYLFNTDQATTRTAIEAYL